MIHRCRATSTSALVAIALMLAPAVARAGDESANDRHPAYVDGSAMVELAERGGPTGDIIEVTLKKPMLKALGKAYGRQNNLFGGFLRGLHSIQAVVASSPLYSGVIGNFKTVEEDVALIVSQLEEHGWDRMARVREDSQTVLVYSHIDGDELDGLTVFVLKRDEGEFIFTNIAGKIDLALLPLMGTDMDIPGLTLGVDAIEREEKVKPGSENEATERPDRTKTSESASDGGSY